jgi:hypothetical protein
LNYGSGLIPNGGRQYYPQQQFQPQYLQQLYPQQQFQQSQNYADPVGRTAFPLNNRFRPGPSAFNSGIANQSQTPNIGNPINPQFNQNYDPNVPSQPSQSDTNGWRFANHNGNWWYWMPGEYWASWDGSQWNRYTPAGPPTNDSTGRTMFGNSAPAIARPNINNSTTSRPQDPAAAVPNFQ